MPLRRPDSKASGSFNSEKMNNQLNRIFGNDEEIEEAEEKKTVENEDPKIIVIGKPKKKKYCLSLNEDLYNKLKDESYDHRCSMNEYLVRILENRENLKNGN